MTIINTYLPGVIFIFPSRTIAFPVLLSKYNNDNVDFLIYLHLVTQLPVGQSLYVWLIKSI